MTTKSSEDEAIRQILAVMVMQGGQFGPGELYHIRQRVGIMPQVNLLLYGSIEFVDTGEVSWRITEKGLAFLREGTTTKLETWHGAT